MTALSVRTKNGSIVIPLFLVFLLAATIFFISNFFASSQTDVAAAIESRYSSDTHLSKKMDSSDKWETYSNNKHKFKIKYPKQWPGNNSRTNENGAIFSYERFLSNKVNLTIEIRKDFTLPPNIKPSLMKDDSFYYFKDNNDEKSASITKDNIHYIISLKENAYFRDQAEFRGTFFNILKTFDFLP